ncbi:M23 family metallopeptidase [Staphylococcus chromogenes]|nr:M23 family metallopeptidase [Staphylococcus chromogenes]
MPTQLSTACTTLVGAKEATFGHMKLAFRLICGSLLSIAIAFLAPPSAMGYVHPLTGRPFASGVSRTFDKPAKNWQPGHRGVDLRASPGDKVVSAGAGRVAFVGTIAGVPSISIDHPDGIRTTYQPVHAMVKENDDVRDGQPIGTVGQPTRYDEDLHWGALIGKDDYINPLSLLGSPAIRLKPAGEPGRKPL